MIRTTPELVAEIIEVDEEIPLDPFILAASVLVDRIQKSAEASGLLADGENSGDTTREEKLQQIETWLSAHFYAIRDPRTTHEQAGTVAATYQSKVDLRLFLTHYGQMAVSLDETGTLEDVNRGRRTRTASVSWLGTKEE